MAVSSKLLVDFASAARPSDGGSLRGAAGDAQIRLGAASYQGAGGNPAGADRPDVRSISNTLSMQTDAGGDPVADMPNRAGLSSMLWVWGQFVDHDIDLTPSRSGAGQIEIIVPEDDPVMRPGSSFTINRSAFIDGTGTGTDNPRQFPNAQTSFLDGSQIYGATEARTAALREAGSAKLIVSDSGTIAFGTGQPVVGTGPMTGDTRATDNPGLMSMHAIFAREHNRQVDELAAARPDWSQKQLFEGARARVEAIVQAITFNEFLPNLLGKGGVPDYEGFDRRVDPSVALEFSTAAYRFGHTLVSSTFERANEDGSTHALGDVALMDAFQARGLVEQTGVGALLRGLASTTSQGLDLIVIEDLRSMLFGGGGIGMDLSAINIARGRDNGIPTYNEMRAALGLGRVDGFSEISSDPAIVARLRDAYGDVDLIDLYMGGLAEDPVAGGQLGETFRMIVRDQFVRIRDGDPFWSQDRGFHPDELEDLWATSLSDVILRNSDVQNLQSNVFLAYERIGGDERPNTLNGGAGRDLVIGMAGDDVLNGRGGRDEILGGSGDDVLRGKSGDDILRPGVGSDAVYGGAGADTIIFFGAQSANDVLRGGTGARDAIRVDPDGGVVTLAGSDRIRGVETFDGSGQAVRGGAGDDDLDFSIFDRVRNVDSIRGAEGDDRIIGSRSGDVLDGGPGDDMLRGRAGDDTFFSGPGEDAAYGGSGADTFILRAALSATDRLRGGSGDDTIRLGGEHAVTLAGTGRVSNIETFDGAGRAVLGTEAADVLDFTIFGSVRDVHAVRGLGGHDVILSGRGADRLFGGDGNDVLRGGGGDDALFGGRSRDVLRGGGGDDALFGGRSRDVLLGDGGDDTLTGGGGGDVFQFRANHRGDDTITDFDAAGDDRIELLRFDFGASRPDRLDDGDRQAAIEDATQFGSGGATIDFEALGGYGTLELRSVRALDFDDFIFG